LFLRQNIGIKAKLDTEKKVYVTFKEPIPTTLGFFQITDGYALVTCEGKKITAAFYSGKPAQIEIATHELTLHHPNMFCFAAKDRLIVTDTDTVAIVSQDKVDSFTLDTFSAGRSSPIEAALYGNTLAFLYDYGEWGSKIISCDLSTHKGGVIWRSKTDYGTHGVLGLGQNDLCAFVGDKMLSWRGMEPPKIKTLKKVSQYVFQCGPDRVLALDSAGAIIDTSVEGLVNSDKGKKTLRTTSRLKRIVYFDGIRVIGNGGVEINVQDGKETRYGPATYQMEHIYDAP
jgi:hypothetical protein